MLLLLGRSSAVDRIGSSHEAETVPAGNEETGIAGTGVVAAVAVEGVRGQRSKPQTLLADSTGRDTRWKV